MPRKEQIPNTDDIDQGALDLTRELAEELSTRSFPGAYYVAKESEWKASQNTITGDEAIALIDQGAQGYARYSSNKIVEEADFVRLVGHKKPPRPDSFNDDSRWEFVAQRRKKDPWVYQNKLPLKMLTGPLDGRVVVFSCNHTEPGRVAVGMLLLAASGEERKDRWRPHVKLSVVGDDSAPTFQILEFTDDRSAIPGLSLAKGNADAKPAPRANGDAGKPIDDEIPF